MRLLYTSLIACSFFIQGQAQIQETAPIYNPVLQYEAHQKAKAHQEKISYFLKEIDF